MDNLKNLKLKIGFFNINGLVGETTFDTDFEETIKKFDIITLTETWHQSEDCISKIKGNFPTDYKFIDNARKKKHKKSKRNSGGILICYKKCLSGSIVIIDKTTENMIWFKIKKEFLNINQDVIIGGIYISPINSSYTKSSDIDIFEKIQEKIMTFSQNDYVLFGGDFNARVGNMQDFIEENDEDIELLNLPQQYQIDRYKKLRSNQDQHKNAYGEKLIELAISSKMKILNGRILGDLLGKYTYLGYNGISAVDYVLGSEKLLMENYIHSFEVEELTLLSDHRPISVTLHYNATNKNKEKKNTNSTTKRRKVVLKNYEIYKTELNKQMNSNQVTCLINKLENIKDKGDIPDLNKIVNDVKDMYLGSAGSNENIRVDKTRTKRNTKKSWYSPECNVLKRKLNQIRKNMDRNPNKKETRILFYKIQKEYKKLIKYKRRKYEENISGKLESLYSQNRNEFWKYLKSMKGTSKNDDLPQLDKLISHFRNLYFDANAESNLANLKEHDGHNMNKQKFEILNRNLTEEEVTKCIKILKNKKSPGDDQITNEMIKCTNAGGIKLLTKLFNTILNYGYFPKEWNYGLLRLIHKGGETDNEDNYRAITLNSCLGKLFCTILNHRLNPLLEAEDIFCKEQSGFRKNHRTTDHIFLLRKIVKSYTSQNRYLYTCFVDFSKAFDSIWRKGLIDKLTKTGINGKFLNIIKSIYDSTTNSIIYNEYLSEVFTSNKGVKQGDTLSTTLFNLFINDLPDIFKFDGNNPITIGNSEISCLKYADDLIIMSTSPTSLQKSIANLEQYCTKWKLEVNLKKTKIMIFNKQGSLIKKYKFYYRNKIIQNTREYKYLGFTFSCSGSDNIGINILLNQAKKAWYSIQQILCKSIKKNVQTYLHLFDTQVKPVMLYACEIWADSIRYEGNITKLLQTNNLEKFHISVLKRLLGVHKKTTNIALLLETGRHPITLSAHIQAIKYFIRLPATKKQTLLNIYYEKEKGYTPCSDNFLKYAINKLDKIGMSNIWREQLLSNKDFSGETKLLADIKARLKDISSQTIINEFETNVGKLTFLALTKKTHKYESYLNINNFEHRRAISKIRTSSHRLEIETGRWSNIPRNQRYCKNCILQKVEDERHFLFECHIYQQERKELYNTIKSKINVDLSRSPTYEKLEEFFYSGDLAILNAFGKFVKNGFQKRENTICHIVPHKYIYYQTI